MSNIIQPSYNKSLNLLLFFIGFMVACGSAMSPFLTVPQFRAAFSASGIQLPWFTQAAMSYYPTLLLLPFTVLIAWWLWPNKLRRGAACAAIGIGGSVILVGLLVAALQYPAFRAAGALGNGF
ncbi:MAG TPA: hypothetical protein VFW82_01615 [Dyella sp.]|nr:hypothetical protein [Dyella sp.]